MPSFFRSDGSIGGILRNETIELNSVTYAANASIIVSSGATLNLGSDVDILFTHTDSGIQVMDGGVFNVNGPVSLMPKDSDSQWFGIRLDTNNDTSLNNLVIKRGKDCIKQSNDVGGTVFVNNTYLYSCSQAGFHFDSQASLLVISNSLVWNAGTYGLFVRQNVQDLHLMNSEFTNCTNNAIYVRQTRNVTLFGNDIMHASSSDALYIFRPIAIFMRANQIQCWRSCFNFNSQNLAYIQNNMMSGLDNLAAFQLAHVSASSSVNDDGIIFTGNIFKNWTTISYDAVTFSYSGPGNVVQMNNNTFQDIQARHILTLSISSTEVPINIANKFMGNLEAKGVSSSSILYISGWSSDTSNSLSTLKGNIFDFEWQNTTDEYALRVNSLSTSIPEIDACLSYWGGIDETLIQKRIYDGLDDADLSLVKYLPFLLTTDQNGPKSTNTTTLSFERPGGILNGVLHLGENLTLTANKSPYKSEGTLIIDGKLTIENNVTIHMKESSSFVVRKGEMFALGAPEAPIIFDKEDEGFWEGISIDAKYYLNQGFQILLAYTNDGNEFSVGKLDFNTIFQESSSQILYRYCPFCTETHKNIFYKRISNYSNFDAFDVMSCTWISENNTLNTDFGKFEMRYVCNF